MTRLGQLHWDFIWEAKRDLGRRRVTRIFQLHWNIFAKKLLIQINSSGLHYL